MAFDTAPPIPGRTTVILAVPAVVRSDARMLASSLVELTYLVVRAAPLHLTTVPGVKRAPLTVSVNAPLPAGLDAGLNRVM